MMRMMISQPMNGKSEEEIRESRNRAIASLMKLPGTINILNTDFRSREIKEGNIRALPLYYLSESLKSMSTCDAVYFCKGWENARGCKIEHAAAEAYGLSIIEEE